MFCLAEKKGAGAMSSVTVSSRAKGTGLRKEVRFVPVFEEGSEGALALSKGIPGRRPRKSRKIIMGA